MLVHKTLREYPQSLNAKISGQWKQANPGQWMEREQINITVGLTKNQRMIQAAALEKIIGQQVMLMQQGEGVLADKSGLYRALLDQARMFGINRPEKFWISPDSPESQQAQMQQAQMAQMQQQMAQQLQQFQMSLQERAIGAQEAEVQRNWKGDIEELQFKYNELAAQIQRDYAKIESDAETAEAKIVGDATTKLEVESIRQSGERARTEMEQ